MKKLIPSISTVFLLLTVPVWSAKFWEKSQFPDWSDKDVIKMLKNSPWAKEFTVTLKRYRGVTNTTMQSGRRGGPRASSGGSFGRSGGGAGRGGRSGGLSGGFFPSMTLTLRWYSALPIKQAFARARFGDQAETATGATELLAPEHSHYILGLSGLPPRMIQVPPERLQHLTERLKSETFLKIKGRDPIQVQMIQVRKEQAQLMDATTGQAGAELLMVFNRKAEHPITVKDKNIEFISRLMDRKISKKFKLKNMVFNGNLEL